VPPAARNSALIFSIWTRPACNASTPFAISTSFRAARSGSAKETGLDELHRYMKPGPASVTVDPATINGLRFAEWDVARCRSARHRVAPAAARTWSSCRDRSYRRMVKRKQPLSSRLRQFVVFVHLKASCDFRENTVPALCQFGLTSATPITVDIAPAGRRHSIAA
jgi:hypothetical protein